MSISPGDFMNGSGGYSNTNAPSSGANGGTAGDIEFGDVLTGGSKKADIPLAFWIGLGVFALCVLVKKKH